jgi:hypothetical protein
VREGGDEEKKRWGRRGRERWRRMGEEGREREKEREEERARGKTFSKRMLACAAPLESSAAARSS